PQPVIVVPPSNPVVVSKRSGALTGFLAFIGLLTLLGIAVLAGLALAARPPEPSPTAFPTPDPITSTEPSPTFSPPTTPPSTPPPPPPAVALHAGPANTRARCSRQCVAKISAVHSRSVRPRHDREPWHRPAGDLCHRSHQPRGPRRRRSLHLRRV